jgi:hypothetical protein
VDSGSVADFCANHQLPVHSFYFWRRKLASHFKPIKRKNLADARLAENALQFIPLQLRGVTPEVTVDLPSGLVLHIPTDPMILQPVLQVLIQLGASRQS